MYLKIIFMASIMHKKVNLRNLRQTEENFKFYLSYKSFLFQLKKHFPFFFPFFSINQNDNFLTFELNICHYMRLKLELTFFQGFFNTFLSNELGIISTGHSDMLPSSCKL